MSDRYGIRVIGTTPEGGNPDDLQFSVRLEVYDVETGTRVGRVEDLTLSAGGLGNDPAQIKAAVESVAADHLATTVSHKSQELDVLKPVFAELATIDIRMTPREATDRVEAKALEAIEEAEAWALEAEKP